MVWIHAVIDVPADLHAAAADFWGRALGWPAGEHWPGHPELRSFEPPAGTPYVHLQEIGGPPRVHVDVSSADPERTLTSAVELGATLVARYGDWTTLLSPGGLPFCVCPSGHREAPVAVRWPGGHRSRLVQVCIDSPRDVHQREVRFWRDLLGGDWSDRTGPEFDGRWRDDESPIQLLFQVLDEQDGPTRAHLDLGADDVPAEVARLRAEGARDLGPGRVWHVLEDPSGLPFCVTPNSPA